MANRIHSYDRPLACRSDQIPCLRPAASPIADNCRPADNLDVVRGNSNIERPYNFAAPHIDLMQSIGKISADVEFLPILRERQSTRDFLLPFGGIGTR